MKTYLSFILGLSPRHSSALAVLSDPSEWKSNTANLWLGNRDRNEVTRANCNSFPGCAFFSFNKRKTFTRPCLVLSTHLGNGTLNSFQLITNLLKLEQKSTSSVLGKSNAWPVCHECLLLMARSLISPITRSMHWFMQVGRKDKLHTRYYTSLMDRLNFCP